MPSDQSTAAKIVWIVRPAFALGDASVEVGPEDDLAELVERVMAASPTSEVIITQEIRN